MQNFKDKSKILGPKTVNIFDRQKIEVVGALEIISSTEKEIYIKLASGIMVILGEMLTILKLCQKKKLWLFQVRLMVWISNQNSQKNRYLEGFLNNVF